MGRVYAAEHTALNRVVAVKVLIAPTGDALALDRFHREARAAAALDHPNIVRLYDIGRDGDTHYLVLEFVAGTDLQQLLEKSGPLAYPQAVESVAQAAAGLGHAHGKGFIHRDIKPANLMRTPDGVVKVLDMGLARSVADPADHLTGRTDSAAVVGTVDYLSPEQTVGAPLDAGTDIYSLGGTLVALLTGGPPYSGTTAQKLLSHQLAPPPNLSRELGDRVPPGLSAVVSRMLAKRPADRFQSAAEVIDALAPWRGAVAVAPTAISRAALPPGPSSAGAATVRLPAAVPIVPSTSTPRRVRGWWVAAIAAVLIVGVTVAAVTGLFADRPPSGGPFVPPPDPANPPAYAVDFGRVRPFALAVELGGKDHFPEQMAASASGWMIQTFREETAAVFAVAPDPDGAFAAVAATGYPVPQWIFHPHLVEPPPLVAGTAYLAAIEYRCDGPTLFGVQAMTDDAFLGHTALPPAAEWRTAAVAFTAPPGTVKVLVKPETADGKTARFRRLRIAPAPRSD